MSTRTAISKCPVFEGVPTERAEAVLNAAQLRAVDAGEILIDEGVPNEHLHLVVSGSLRVMLPVNENRMRTVHIADLEVGAIAGEYSAFDKREASARVSAVEATELLTLSGADFVAALEADPATAKQVYRNLLQLLIERLREKDAEVDLILPF